MLVVNLSDRELKTRLADQGIALQIGPFVVQIQTSIESVARGISALYSRYSLADQEAFVDFRLAFSASSGIRRFIKPQVQFSFDGLQPFVPLPLHHAFPMFEWALNWCIAKNAHQFLIIHGAVIEKNGMALVMPGVPGAGKSTLCAVLVNHGWRLLTDELAMISADGRLMPIPRPVSLKNASIEIVRRYAPDAVFGELFLDTKKGTVAHMKPSDDSVSRMFESAAPAWLVMPRYIPRSGTSLRPLSKGKACLHLANNSFNYNILDEQGFYMLTDFVDRCDCYDFSYSDLDSAIEVFNQLSPPSAYAA